RHSPQHTSPLFPYTTLFRSKNPIATPGKIPWLKASPTKLMRLSIISAPTSPDESAIIIDATSARRKKGNSRNGAINHSYTSIHSPRVLPFCHRPFGHFHRLIRFLSRREQ